MMTTTRTHQCNLCRTYVQDGTGVGLRWGGHPEAITFTILSGAENHVCQKCLTQIEKAILDQRKHAQVRAEVDNGGLT
jgi:nanoRNase/pAp phosphatase (c-di-AMP/oligoRNAs hydrolase)